MLAAPDVRPKCEGGSCSTAYPDVLFVVLLPPEEPFGTPPCLLLCRHCRDAHNEMIRDHVRARLPEPKDLSRQRTTS
jgi:hypothetical protein